MVSRTYTAAIQGLDIIKVDVEVDGNRGTPALVFIGLPSKATAEAKERITSALQNCGVRLRSKRTVVNLAPADLPKTGTAFDLAIAVGLLKMYKLIPDLTDDTLFLGELSLDGTVKKISGTLVYILSAKKMGFTHVVIPAGNAQEVQSIPGLHIHVISHLQEYIECLHAHHSLPEITGTPYPGKAELSRVTFSDIYGQEHAKRALLIAAAGGHHILLHGPPGSGKTLLANAFQSLLPPLSEEEILDVTRIYSVCGLTQHGLIRHRPFRSPHHSISEVGLIGGGAHIRPGEISLAHRGVLFLDEVLEFPRAHLETLRQPLESGSITLTRASGSIHLPAAFTLVGAMNPCPCGYFQSVLKQCHCLPTQVEQYQKKISGPLLDRIDVHVRVGEVPVKDKVTPFV